MDQVLSGTILLLIETNRPNKLGLNKEKNQIKLRGLGISEEHAVINSNNDKFTIQACNDSSKVLRNGHAITVNPVELNHMDRLLFGASQYYVFVDPSKKTAKDPDYTFETMQDEIARASGLISKDAKQNMTPEEIAVQNELVDLLPAIEEANQISIKLDRKVKFTALPVSSEARGEYDGKVRAFVSVKNFVSGLEWIWTKQKFLDRKIDMTEMYNDFIDDGIINRDKFKVFFFTNFSII
jgi:kinesin family protein 1